jgi:O-antigen/teichoic acid export membrane protein
MTTEVVATSDRVNEIHEISLGQELRGKLGRDFANYFLSKIIPGIMGLLAVMIFVRIAGLEQYGIYSVALALCMSVGTGLSGWISQGILRFQSAHSAALEFNRVVVIGTLLSILAATLLLAVLLPVLGHANRLMIPAGILLGCSFLGYNTLLGNLQAKLHSRGVLFVEAGRSVLAFLLPAGLALVNRSNAGVMLVLGLGIAYLVPSLVSFLWLSGGGAQSLLSDLIPAKQERGLLLTLFQFGWPLAAWFFVIQFLGVSDRYFLQRYSLMQAGAYASMYDTIVRSLSLLFTPIILAVHPVVMRHWNQGQRQRALSIIRKGIRFEVLSFLPILIAFVLGARLIVRLILGHSLPGAELVVAPLLVSGFLWQLALLVHKPLEILCKTRRMLLAISVSLAVNLVGNILFIPRYGFLAPACTGALAAFVYIAMVYILIPRAKLIQACAFDVGGD